MISSNKNDVGGGEGIHPGIDFVSLLLIALEADVGKFRLGEAGINRADADAGVEQLVPSARVMANSPDLAAQYAAAPA